MSAKSEFKPPGFERKRQMLAVRAAGAASSGRGQRPHWAGHVDILGVVAVALRLASLQLQAVWRCIIDRPQFLAGAQTRQEARLRLRMSLAR
ncbi:hypothetical protein SAMN04488238_11411 [Roseicitreum antarcticum]|uniref:Uncharacterized protein n=1 Tax=Roseicitreum antarcticum TaxID=564137 RepID=A0A1H3DJI5_9RHOB|nr:hypothetical protein SAMN04488238_11411 [Roseicitreum antarcticum]